MIDKLSSSTPEVSFKPCPFCGKPPTLRGDRLQCDDHTYALNMNDWDDQVADAFVPSESGAKHERETLALIDQRDAAEEAVSEIYFLITGKSPEWSNLFGFPQAIEEISEAFDLVRAAAKFSLSARGEREPVKGVDGGVSGPNWQTRFEWLLRRLEEPELFRVVPKAADTDGMFTLERIAEVIDEDLYGPHR